MANALFYALSLAAVALAVRVIAARSPMQSVLALLGTFMCLALIYLLAGFPFLATAQVLVYAGAIMVLFLFVIMLLDLGDVRALVDAPTRRLGRARVAIAALASAALAAVGLVAARSAGTRGAGAHDATAGRALDDLNGLAAELFSRFALPFEAASLLLLATMVAVIALAKRDRGATRGGPSGASRAAVTTGAAVGTGARTADAGSPLAAGAGGIGERA